MPSVVRILLGAVFGAAVAGLVAFGLLSLLSVDADVGMPVAAVAGAIGGTYTAIALGFKIYALRFFSVVGLLLDLTWSLVNTLGGLLVWIPLVSSAGRVSSHPPPTAADRGRSSTRAIHGEAATRRPQLERSSPAAGRRMKKSTSGRRGFSGRFTSSRTSSTSS